MKVQTFTIVAGSEACNARCPFCISKMTPNHGMTLKEQEVNWRNFDRACRFAEMSGVTTVLITGKGEPTLFPEQITKYIQAMKKYNFPFIELQTNGIALAEQREKYDEHIRNWYDAGLTIVAISIVDVNEKINREIYMPHREKYIELPELTDYLHERGLSIRLSAVMIMNGIDSIEKLEELVEFGKKYGVEQLSIRPVARPIESKNRDYESWIVNNYVKQGTIEGIRDYLNKEGTKLLELLHGATVYDLRGQNICLTNCLTRDVNLNKLRQLIFFPDGHLRYDWEKGAILL